MPLLVTYRDLFMQALSNGESYFDVSYEKGNFSYDQFEQVEFEECQFIDCDFSESKFQHCKFINCTFERCNLSVVDVSGSKFFDVHFQDCKLVGIDWTRAEWATYHVDFELKFTRSILNDSSFFGLTLNALQLEECKLHDVDFREGNFCDAAMTGCDFARSVFMRTDLSKVDFTDSENYIIDVLENNIKQAKFSRYEALNLLESLGIELVD